MTERKKDRKTNEGFYIINTAIEISNLFITGIIQKLF
jgi:hypothetical protein